MNIREAHEKFASDEQCLAYIEMAGSMAWFDALPASDLLGLYGRPFQPVLPVHAEYD